MICDKINEAEVVSEWLQENNVGGASGADADTGIVKNAGSGNNTRNSAAEKTVKAAETGAKRILPGSAGKPGEELKKNEESSGGWIKELGDSIQNLEDSHMEYLNLFLFIIIILLLLLLGNSGMKISNILCLLLKFQLPKNIVIVGTCKGLWGIVLYPVGRCCLRRFYDKPRILSKYYEPKYSNYTVTHDSAGYPLDPFTRKRTVKRLNPWVLHALFEFH